MSKKIDWVPNADLSVGKGATHQEFDANVGTDQLAIETTPWGEGDLRINGLEVAHVCADTQLQAFQDLERIAQAIPENGKRDEADPIARESSVRSCTPRKRT